MTIGLIITAAGQGKRFGAPEGKVMTSLLGKPIIAHTLEQFINAPEITQCIITVAPGQESNMNKIVATVTVPFSVKVIVGGELRQHSVQLAVKAMSNKINNVLVHDGARPIVKQRIINDLLAEKEKYNAVIPAIPVTDTIKVVDKDSMVIKTLTRQSLRAVQTPQLFSVKCLKMIYQKAPQEVYTDEAMLVEGQGVLVKTIPGDPQNIKLTYPNDLQALEIIKSNISSL
tara:strand:- start:324 stop:1010 length:687 start_codon:yes stop_codon:yes gene_type:complete